MYEFTYVRATSTDQATKVLGDDDEATLIAGGQTLIPTLKQRLAAPTQLVDISRIPELQGITQEGDSIVIGAMTCHADVQNSDLVKSTIPGLAALAAEIGDPHVRNRGTIGGSVANNDPAADYPAALLALGATVKTNQRELSAEDFFVGLFETALEEDEIVTSITLPIPQAMAYAKHPNPASRYALVGVCVARTTDGMRVAVTGSGHDGVFRWEDAEEALGANFAPDALQALSVDPDDLMSDIHGQADYRSSLISVMAARAVTAAGA